MAPEGGYLEDQFPLGGTPLSGAMLVGGRVNRLPLRRSFGNRSRLWRMSSAAAAGRFSAENENEAEALDFAFIDADHSYAAAKEDAGRHKYVYT